MSCLLVFRCDEQTNAEIARSVSYFLLYYFHILLYLCDAGTLTLLQFSTSANIGPCTVW
jgi:hypothetical protein